MIGPKVATTSGAPEPSDPRANTSRHPRVIESSDARCVCFPDEPRCRADPPNRAEPTTPRLRIGPHHSESGERSRARGCARRQQALEGRRAFVAETNVAIGKALLWDPFERACITNVIVRNTASFEQLDAERRDRSTTWVPLRVHGATTRGAIDPGSADMAYDDCGRSTGVPSRVVLRAAAPSRDPTRSHRRACRTAHTDVSTVLSATPCRRTHRSASRAAGRSAAALRRRCQRST